MTKTHQKQLLNGNELIAHAALHSGVDYFSHYPGSPVNFIEPCLKKLAKTHKAPIKFNDSLNEHVAALSAAGASFCGARSMVVMKHVGVNIAADPFNYIGYTGVKGGMLIIVGTDPGANSSTGEEDVHWFIPQFNFPLFEPTSISETFDLVQKAYELSEEQEIPVVIFMPVRLCNHADFVSLPEYTERKRPDFYFEKDRDKYINVGQRAIRNHRKLLGKISAIGITYHSEKRFYSPMAKIGIITRGLCLGHAHESIEQLGLDKKVDLLNIERVFPINKNQILKFCEGKEEIIVIEDQDGFLENQIKMECFNEISVKIYGKEFFPKYGEISYDQVLNFFADKFEIQLPSKGLQQVIEVPERLGTFCEGCPHTAAYFSIDQALKDVDGIIGGDIGCSSLPPFRADWLMCMNAGIGVSQGMAHLLNHQVVVSTGGDGSFFHGGLLSLQSAVENKIDLIHVVLDNRSIAMTGHQDSPSNHVDHVKLLESIGVDKVISVSAFEPVRFTYELKKELQQKGVRVFWVSGQCALQLDDARKEKIKKVEVHIDNSKCGSCNLCYEELACPAIQAIDFTERDLKIDLDLCVRCGACKEICPNNAVIHLIDETL